MKPKREAPNYRIEPWVWKSNREACQKMGGSWVVESCWTQLFRLEEER